MSPLQDLADDVDQPGRRLARRARPGERAPGPRTTSSGGKLDAAHGPRSQRRRRRSARSDDLRTDRRPPRHRRRRRGRPPRSWTQAPATSRATCASRRDRRRASRWTCRWSSVPATRPRWSAASLASRRTSAIVQRIDDANFGVGAQLIQADAGRAKGTAEGQTRQQPAALLGDRQQLDTSRSC